MRIGVFLLLLVVTGPLIAQEDSLFIRKIADEVLGSGKTYENLRVLCKTIGGRLSGSPQMVKAEQWGLNTLKAVGSDQAFLQECTVPHWVRGGKDVSWISYADNNGRTVRKQLDVLAIGNSIGTGKQGIQAPLMLVHDFDELEKRKDEVKGKVVYFNNAFNPANVQTRQSYGESGIYRRSGASRAANYGAVAILTRSLSIATDNYPHTGSLVYDSNQAKIPGAAMGLRDADSLDSLFKTGRQITAYLRTMAQFLPDTIGHNVIGELKGSLVPEEFITVGGHLDSWDVAEGAHDDGAGCVQSIEVLRVLKKLGYKPKRTIRVVLFANEENGLKGGTRYAQVAKEKNEKHLFALESDNGGFTPRGFDFDIAPPTLTRIRQWLPLFEPYGVYFFGGGGGGADVGPLHQGLGTVVSEFRPDSQRYFDIHHTRNDVFENVHKRELELGALNMTALIYLVDKYGLQ